MYVLSYYKAIGINNTLLATLYLKLLKSRGVLPSSYLYQVAVGFSLWVPVVKFAAVVCCVDVWVQLFQFLDRHTIGNAVVQFVEGFRCDREVSISVQETQCLPRLFCCNTR